MALILSNRPVSWFHGDTTWVAFRCMRLTLLVYLSWFWLRRFNRAFCSLTPAVWLARLGPVQVHYDRYAR